MLRHPLKALGAGGALLTVLLGGACSSGTTSPDRPAARGSQGDVVQVTFRQHYGASAVLPGTPRDTTTKEWLTLGPDGKLIGLRSLTVATRGGAPLQESSWKEGDTSVRVTDLRACRSSREPLPTKPTKNQVLQDAVGPLNDPTRNGYHRVKDHVYTRVEGMSRWTLRTGSSLSRRTITMTDPEDGRVQSRIDHISLRHVASVPEGSAPTCSRPANRTTLG